MNALKLVEHGMAERGDDLQARCKAQVTENARLQQAACDADAVAQQAQRAFKATPTKETRDDRDISAQLWENAKEACAAHAKQIAPLIEEAASAAKRAELTSLAARCAPDEFRRFQERATDLIANLRRELRGTLAEAHEAVRVSNELRQRARSLAQELGEPSSFDALSLPYLFGEEIANVADSTGRGATVFFKVIDTGIGPAGIRFTLQLTDAVLGGGT